MAGRRDHVLQVRVTDDGLGAIDKARGAWTRSEYVRAALSAAIKKGMKGPAPVKPAEDF